MYKVHLPIILASEGEAVHIYRERLKEKLTIRKLLYQTRRKNPSVEKGLRYMYQIMQMHACITNRFFPDDALNNL